MRDLSILLRGLSRRRVILTRASDLKAGISKVSSGPNDNVSAIIVLHDRNDVKFASYEPSSSLILN